MQRLVICRRGIKERRFTAIGEPKAKTEQMYRCVTLMSESVPEVNTLISQRAGRTTQCQYDIEQL